MQGIEKKILIIVLVKLWSGDSILSLSDARISEPVSDIKQSSTRPFFWRYSGLYQTLSMTIRKLRRTRQTFVWIRSGRKLGLPRTRNYIHMININFKFHLSNT